MSENAPHTWSGNHYCAKDARHLMYHPDGDALRQAGYPEQLSTNPVPASFCSYCMGWFDDPALDHHHTGSDPRPPEKGTTNG
jgi:hypothetical protein